MEKDEKTLEAEAEKELKEEFEASDKKKKEEATSLDLKRQLKLAKAMELAKAPIVLKDEDVAFAPREFDVRNVSAKTYRQIDYKFLSTQTALLNDISQSLIDTQRLLMVLLRKMGVESVTKELDDLYAELSKESEEALSKRG